MTGPRGQARPAGRDPGKDGGPTLSARFRFLLLMTALGLLVQGSVVPARADQAPGDAPAAQAEAEPPAPPVPPETTTRSFQFRVDLPDSAERDSLLLEIRKYSAMISDLRDSLGGRRDEIHLSPEHRARLENSVGELVKVVERISTELGRMEFEVKDNTISLLDETGEGIVITIPENLPDQLSERFHDLSRIILAEPPDTVRAGVQQHLSWLGSRPPKPPREARKVVQGNLVKIWDDLLVPWGEEVRGQVVVVFGNAEVQGRVDGNVVVVFGNLQLGDSAEVTGQVVTVGGRLDQAAGATAGDVFVLDPLGSRRGFSPLALMGEGVRGFLICQSLFLLMLVVALVAALAAPAHRFDRVLAAVRENPASSLGYGVLIAIGGHVVVLLLAAVLVLTVIGIPVALLVWLAVIVAGVVATAVAAAALGERLCRGRDGGCPSRWLAVLVGMLVLHALSFLGSLMGLFPGAGAAAMLFSVAGLLVKACAYFIGLGALVMSRFGTARSSGAASFGAGNAEFSPSAR